jgi:hypothetical protein
VTHRQAGQDTCSLKNRKKMGKGQGGMADRDSNWRSHAAVQAIYNALHVIQQSSSLLRGYAPLRSEQYDGSGSFLEEIRTELRFSARYIKAIEPAVSGVSSSEVLGDKYLQILNWTVDELKIVLGRRTRIDLLQKIARVDRYGSGDQIDQVIKIIRRNIREVHIALETALLQESVVLFADVDKIQYIRSEFSSSVANAILRDVTAPLDLVSEQPFPFTDSHVLGFPVRQNLTHALDQVLERCFLAIERSRETLESGTEMAYMKAGLMIGIGLGKAITIDGKVEPLSISDGLIAAYNAHHFMDRHQICVSENVFTGLYFSEKYRNLCTREPVVLRNKELILYQVKAPDGKPPSQLKKRIHP